jgi:hypothetical protein
LPGVEFHFSDGPAGLMDQLKPVFPIPESLTRLFEGFQIKPLVIKRQIPLFSQIVLDFSNRPPVARFGRDQTQQPMIESHIRFIHRIEKKHLRVRFIACLAQSLQKDPQ